MNDKRKFEYFLLQYVPNVPRGEFVNIGLVMTEIGGDGGGFAGLHLTSDWSRAHCLDPSVDVEMLKALGQEMKRRLENAEQRALLLHEMMDSWSNLLQISPIWKCNAENPAETLKALARELVEIATPTLSTEERERPARKVGRRWIYAGMREAFASTGAWDFLVKDLRASTYTNPADDFVFDLAYPVGEELKIFHAVSLAAMGVETRIFPLKVAQIAPRMRERNQVIPKFTAVVEDEFDEADKRVRSVLASMEDEKVYVARLREMPGIADVARWELGA